MRILIISFILLIVTFQGLSQEVEVNSKGIFLNSNKITIDSSRDSLLQLLGGPNRKAGIRTPGDYAYWIYDELGFRLIFTDNIEAIEITFKPEGRDAFPKQNFRGNLTIFGLNICCDTPITEVKKIKELKYEKNVSSDSNYVARVKNLILFFGYDTETSKINGVSINQKIYVLIDYVNSDKSNNSL